MGFLFGATVGFAPLPLAFVPVPDALATPLFEAAGTELPPTAPATAAGLAAVFFLLPIAASRSARVVKLQKGSQVSGFSKLSRRATYFVFRVL
jgi:hypothetical protein